MVAFVPWKNHGGPIIQLQVGKLVGSFLLDTGASFPCMSEGFAKKLGLKSYPAVLMNGRVISMAPDAGQMSQYVEVNDVIMGDVDLGKVQFILLHDSRALNAGEQPIDGIVGGPFLAASAILIDYPRKTLTLIHPGKLTDDEISQLNLDDAARVPFKRDGDGLPHMLGQDQWIAKLSLRNGAAETSQDVVLDTGSPATYVSQQTADRVNLVAIHKASAATLGSGSSFMSVGRVSQATLGGLAIPDLMVSYPGRQHAPDIPSLLGENVFSYCTALFDFRARMLYLKPVLPPLAPMPTTLDPAAVDGDRGWSAREMREIPAPVGADSMHDTASPDADDLSEPSVRIAALQRTADAANAADHWARIGNLYDEQEEFDRAIEAYQHAVDGFQQQALAHPTDVKPLVQLVRAQLGARQEDAAEQTARRATALAPNDPDACIALGWALHARSLRALTGSTESVDVTETDQTEFQDLMSRLGANPPSADAITRAQALSGAARDCFDRAVALAPDATKPYLVRAMFLEDDGLGIQATLQALNGTLTALTDYTDTPAIRDDLRAAAERDPDNPDIQYRWTMTVLWAPMEHNERGIDLRRGKYWQALPSRVRNEAEKGLSRLHELAKSPDSPLAARALTYLGDFEHAIDDDEGAETLLRQAIDKDSRREDAVYSLVSVLRSGRRYDEIVTLLSDRVAKQDSAIDRLLLARALCRSDRFDEAETQAQRAAALAPDSVTANLASAILLLHNSPGADNAAERRVQAGALLDRAEKDLGAAPHAAARVSCDEARAVYVGITGDPVRGANIVLKILSDEPYNTEARDILGGLLLPPHP
jgi:tetratricopeptide (TPR) repeat protein